MGGVIDRATVQLIDKQENLGQRGIVAYSRKYCSLTWVFTGFYSTQTVLE